VSYRVAHETTADTQDYLAHPTSTLLVALLMTVRNFTNLSRGDDHGFTRTGLSCSYPDRFGRGSGRYRW
jgi:hypothetical protein